MSIFSLRMNNEESKIIKDYAKLNNLTVSELLRSSVLEKIESNIDLTLYKEAMNEYMSFPSDISLDDMMKELQKD